MCPKVSVIVPVYNVEKYLERCVDSLRNQTLREIEIILIDDGSTDKSGIICDQYKEKDVRIKVIHKKNEGQGLARNTGLDIAKGKYIAFLDSDDYMEEDAYEKISRNMDEEQAELCCFGYVKQNEKGKIFYRSELNREIYELDDIRNLFILHFFGDEPGDSRLSGVSACMTMYSREIISREKIRFNSERIVLSEDTIFNLDYCHFVNRAVVMADELYHYCQKTDSFSKRYRPERYERTEQFCNILKAYAEEYNIVEEVENRIRMVFWVTLMECVKQEMGRWKETGFLPVYKQVKEICGREYTQTIIGSLITDGMGSKQRLLLIFIKKKMIPVVMLLGYLRMKRGL